LSQCSTVKTEGLAKQPENDVSSLMKCQVGVVYQEDEPVIVPEYRYEKQ